MTRYAAIKRSMMLGYRIAPTLTNDQYLQRAFARAFNKFILSLPTRNDTLSHSVEMWRGSQA